MSAQTRAGHQPAKKFGGVMAYYAGIRGGGTMRWLARFRAATIEDPRTLATLLWPPRAGESIEVWPAWRLGGVEGAKRIALELPGYTFDCPLHAIFYKRGEFEAWQQGHEGKPVCRFCGCWELHACAGGCWWVAPSLCSGCCRRFGVDPVKRAQLEPDRGPA